jgi:DNA polymerase-3 subunit delta
MLAAMPEPLSPITIVTGSEELLVERVVRSLLKSAGASDQVEVQRIEAVALEAGQLTIATSPSLFGGPPVVVVQGIERLVQTDDNLEVPLNEVLGYLAEPSLDACVILVHGGGNGGKAVLTAAKKAGAVIEATPSPKKGAELRNHRRQFVKEELRSLECSISPQAAEALIDAVGTNLRELAAACSQLASDRGATGRIDESDIMRYYDGKAEVKTFDVADRVVAGHTAEALGLFRHARDGGTPVVLFPAALARTLRQLALVASAPRGASASQLAASAELPDWKLKHVRENARHWTEGGLVNAIRAVAEADAAIKGGEADADYALERMLITVGRSRGRA